MLQNITLIYDGPTLTGANGGLIYYAAPFAGNLQRIDLVTDLNVAGDCIFSVSKNGVLIGDSTLTISNGTRIEQSDALDVDLVFGDEIILNMLSGTLNSTLTMNLVVDDGVEAGASIESTDELTEGATNKYFTNARAIASLITGYVIDVSNTAIAATDSILQAFQKIQGQINTILGTLNNKINSSYLDTDTTLAANSDTKIATQKAIKAYILANAGSGGTSSADVQIFTTTGANTWTKPAGAKTVEVFLIGGGGGGGSGRKGAAGTVRGGGGGGGGGSMAYASFLASALGATETATVGAGGNGGASVTANSSNGNPGTVGGNTSFGNWLIALGGNFGIAGTNAGAQGGASRAGFPSSAATDGGTGGPGASTGGTVAAATALPPSGGGGGGAVTAANAASNGAAGGAVGITTVSGRNSILAGGAVNTNGNDSGNYAMSGGSGGGGGNSSNTGNANNGGNGGLYGAGGGGGGGATDSVGNSGAGGNGAPGITVIVSYY